MKVIDLKNMLNQMNSEDNIVFNVECNFENDNEDIDFTVEKEEAQINNIKIIKSYEEGICENESDYDKSLEINLYIYLQTGDYKEE